jgi:hypothetical protein
MDILRIPDQWYLPSCILTLAALLLAAGWTTWTSTATTGDRTALPPSRPSWPSSPPPLEEAFTKCGRRYGAGHSGTRIVCIFDGLEPPRPQFEPGTCAGIFAPAIRRTDLAKGTGLIDNDSVGFSQNRLAIPADHAPACRRKARLRSDHDLRTGPRRIRRDDQLDALGRRRSSAE